MEITYKSIHAFSEEELKDLFLSVNWSSGHYPEKLVVALMHYETVYSAWAGDRLIGLLSALDDGVMTAYVHYLLVNPEYQMLGIGKRLVELAKEKYKDYLKIILVSYDEGVGFYQSCGFKKGEGECPMLLTSLWT